MKNFDEKIGTTNAHGRTPLGCGPSQATTSAIKRAYPPGEIPNQSPGETRDTPAVFPVTAPTCRQLTLEETKAVIAFLYGKRTFRRVCNRSHVDAGEIVSKLLEYRDATVEWRKSLGGDKK
jgi:hypothetical protein